MDGQLQTFYARKNWSSVILWNCSHQAHARLTHDRLNHWPGRDLHAFKWLEDSEIGELPPEWNHLVGVSGLGSRVSGQTRDPRSHIPYPKLLHYTLGGPWFEDWQGGDLDDLWLQENEFRLMGINRKEHRDGKCLCHVCA